MKDAANQGGLVEPRNHAMIVRAAKEREIDHLARI
jgi:hypothetical protein